MPPTPIRSAAFSLVFVSIYLGGTPPDPLGGPPGFVDGEYAPSLFVILPGELLGLGA